MNTIITLLSGQPFDYNNPEQSDVSIEDIAHALSNVCRFAGHVKYHFSVAQHSVNVSYLCPLMPRTALLHDVSEAVTTDIPTPLKSAVPEFRSLEKRIERSMSDKLKFHYPFPWEVVQADLKALLVEKIELTNNTEDWPILNGIQVSARELDLIDLSPMSPEFARDRFLERYYELQASS